MHDVSGILIAEADRLPADLLCDVGWLADTSRHLRRDRELAFYGTEGLTPSDFYSRTDAVQARDSARRVVEVLYPHVG